MGHPGTRNKTLARSLGEFFGHIRIALRTRPDQSEPHEVSRTIDEETVETSQGKVTLRRTVIEEIDLPDQGDNPPR